MIIFETLPQLVAASLQVGKVVNILGETTEGDKAVINGRVRAHDYTPVNPNQLITIANGNKVELFPGPGVFVTTGEMRTDSASQLGLVYFADYTTGMTIPDGAITAKLAVWHDGQFYSVGTNTRFTSNDFNADLAAGRFKLTNAKSYEVNVMDFGAVGNGIHDDSDAVQLAVKYADVMQWVLSGAQAGGGVYTSTRVPVVFPANYYYFSKPVNLGLFGTIKGIGRPYFSGLPVGSVQARPDHYIFRARSTADGGAGEGVWKYDLSNFICLKAKGFIDFDNGNRNVGDVHIHDFEVKGLETAINIHNAQSSKVVIENFSSDYCDHFVINERCDQSTITKGWISQGKLTKNWDATIHNKRGHMRISEVLGVPTDTHTSQNVAWVNNGDFNAAGETSYTHTYLENFRAGGEYSGVTALNNFVKFDDTYPVWVNGFTITNCELYSLDDRTTTGESTIVRLFAIPNIMVVENNKGGIFTTSGVQWWSGNIVPVADVPTFEWTKSKRNYVWDNPAMDSNLKVFPDKLSNAHAITQLFTDRLSYAAYTNNGGATFKTSYTATAGGVFDLIYVGNPNPPSSPKYRQPITGKVITYSVWDRTDDAYYVDLEFIELARPTKGDAPNPNALQVEVGAYNKNTGAYVTRVPFDDAQNYAVYIEVKGFIVGYENADGYLDFSVSNGLR